MKTISLVQTIHASVKGSEVTLFDFALPPRVSMPLAFSAHASMMLQNEK
jgi:hypothetical protein